MPTTTPGTSFGLLDSEEQRLGRDRATRIRTIRALFVIAQAVRQDLDRRLAPSGLTSQQAALLTIVRAIGRPKLTEVADALHTSHQNAKQLASALVRKGLLTIEVDTLDRRVRRLQTTHANDALWEANDPGDHDDVLRLLADLDAGQVESLFVLLCATHQSIRRHRDRSTD
jgi:DNA-binding MarR family transcriptional regulator